MKRRVAMASNRFPLLLLAEPFAVCRFDPADATPAEVLETGGPFACVVRSENEVSVVCVEEDVPEGATKVERGWRAFRLQGPVPFTTIGVVSGLTKPLAEAGVSVFIVSTFDTDYLLVRSDSVGRASKVLDKAGFEVRGA